MEQVAEDWHQFMKMQKENYKNVKNKYIELK